MHPSDTLRQLRNIIYKEILRAKLPARVKVKMLDELKECVLHVGEHELQLVVNNKKGEKNANRKKTN